MGLLNSKIATTTQADFDVSRYIGRWYEVARYETLSYEKKCNAATADYTWNATNSTLGIRNTCYTDGQFVSVSEGVARIPDMNDKSKLKVKFTTQPSSPFEAPYWCHWTDYDHYAIVGSPGGNFLWVLSRTPQLPRADAPMLLDKVRSFGYDTSKLMAFPQNLS